ncbi:MAG: 50S ribosomal protein L11 methyltransferase [Chitinophagaceae bacterium]|nr:50S ribosomal protein L11 methyltransferase [Chitinophagaceae bacterium]
MENDYIEILFENVEATQIEYLVAWLSDIGYEGFEEGENWLKAFIPAVSFDEKLLKENPVVKNCSMKVSTIAATNWNAVWESNFEPVVVEDFVGLRADFHAPITAVQHEIIITPKMSFGTGHHATTYLMMLAMRQIDFTGKNVFDFGTGTGVLSILAHQLGAKKITAVDNDDWSIENAGENFTKNNCSNIALRQQADAGEGQVFEIILANINKNVLLYNMKKMATQLTEKGVLLLSGILPEDVMDIVNKAKQENLKIQYQTAKNNWVCLQFTH